MTLDAIRGIAGLKGALGYVRSYRDRTIVIKLGGEVLAATLVTFADADDLATLLDSGAMAAGMRFKVEACIRAARGGVERTHVLDGRAPDSILCEVFTGAGCGIMIVARKEVPANVEMVD